MCFEINIPAFADFSEPRRLAELAREAEAAEWDGYFIWDAIFFDPTFHPMADPWIDSRTDDSPWELGWVTRSSGILASLARRQIQEYRPGGWTKNCIS